MSETSFHTRESVTSAKAAELCPLVEQIARKLLRRLPKTVGLDDLIGAGNLGLVHALSKFDPDDDAWFNGYALQRARGAMLDELRKLDPLGRFERRKINHVKNIEHELTQQLGRTPGSEELREAAGLSKKSFHRAMEHARHSFVETLDTTGATVELGFEWPDPWSAEDQTIVQGEAHRLLDRLTVLPQRLQLVLKLYYLEDRTLREIGEQLGVTEPRVHQLRVEALERLRAAFPAYAAASSGSSPKKKRGKPASASSRRRQQTLGASVSILPPPKKPAEGRPNHPSGFPEDERRAA